MIQATERIDVNPVWVELPGLPLDWWTIEWLTALGNKLKVLLVVDEDSMLSSRRVVAKILVNLKKIGDL